MPVVLLISCLKLVFTMLYCMWLAYQNRNIASSPGENVFAMMDGNKNHKTLLLLRNTPVARVFVWTFRLSSKSSFLINFLFSQRQNICGR